MIASDEPMVPEIHIEAEAQYVLGFPMLIAVELRNESADTDYLNLPDLGLLTPHDSVAVVLRPRSGGPALVIGPEFESRDQNLFRTKLLDGERTRVLIDITEPGQPLEAGHYALECRLYSRPGVFRASPAVPVELVEPSAREQAQAQRLRRLGLAGQALDTGSWLPFLTRNRSRVPPPQGLGPTASHQLALHLALHRAAYGPVSLAEMALETFATLQGPVLAPEAAALRYELVAARAGGAQRDAARAAILKQWPILRRRLEQVDRGAGLLTTLRHGYGAERDAPQPAVKPPHI